MRYTDRTRKKVTIPSGFDVEIFAINVQNAPFLEKRVSEDDEHLGRRIQRFISLNKIGTIDGLKVVEVVSNPEKEICIDEVLQADLDFLTGSVMEISGLTKRAEEARKTFPESGTQASGECASTVEALRVPAD